MRTWTAWLLAMVVFALTAPSRAQQQPPPLPPKAGNPTPGTPQPDPPNPQDRITLTGCVQLTPSAPATSAASDTVPSDSRYVLWNTKRDTRVPSDAGTPAATAATYRLEALESQLSPFAGAQVQISGEVKAANGTAPPVLLVEFVQKIASRCP